MLYYLLLSGKEMPGSENRQLSYWGKGQSDKEAFFRRIGGFDFAKAAGFISNTNYGTAFS
jgi:hypothetical protein